MKILLISAPILDRFDDQLVPIAMDAKRVAPPYGIYLLSSVLKNNGYLVDIADLIANGFDELDNVLTQIDNYDLIGIGATSFSWPTARICISKIKSVKQGVPIVLGGIHASMFDHHILSTTKADFIIRGEGEFAIIELCEMLEGKRGIADVTNLSYQDTDGTVVRNNISKVVDLNDIPSPDYSSLPNDAYSGISIESSRGCPFDCIFCSTNYRQTYRSMRPDVFLDRVEDVLPFLSRTVNRAVQIIDDEFTLDIERVMEIVNSFSERNIQAKFVFDARVRDITNEKFVEQVSPHVCRFLVGAESGYDEGLKRIGKKITTATISQAAKILQKYNLSHLCDFSFVIGFPWEDYKDTLRTINFASDMMIEYGVNILLQWYMQIPGSRLWQAQKEEGILDEALYDDFGLFRNPYLFRSGVKLSLEEIDDISETIVSVKMLHEMSGIKNSNTLEYVHPLPISRYFPNNGYVHQYSSGLNSLREISESIKLFR